MESYLDYKATVWFRISIRSEEYLQKVKERVEKGDLPSDLYNYEDDLVGQCEPLYDTEEFINPNENDGQSTIEIYQYQKVNNCTQPVLIWDNSYGSEIKRKET